MVDVLHSVSVVVLHKEMFSVFLLLQAERGKEGRIILRGVFGGYQLPCLAHRFGKFLRNDGLLQIGYTVALESLKRILLSRSVLYHRNPYLLKASSVSLICGCSPNRAYRSSRFFIPSFVVAGDLPFSGMRSFLTTTVLPSF